MRHSATLILAATALAGAQGCTAPAASGPIAASRSPALVEPPPPPSAAGATPVVNRRLRLIDGPGAFISPQDYPAAALQARQQGTVHFRLAVSAQGRVTHCAVLQSSGHSILDSSLCSLLTRRARFTPATDASGNPMAASIDDQYSWRLPDSR
jgi:protein TonB